MTDTEEADDRRWKAEGDLHAWLWEYLGDRFTRLRRLGPDYYRLPDDEEIPAGYEDDDTLFLLRREDGTVFDVGIWVTLRPVPVPEKEG